MIKLGTTFSGIGAPEQALKNLNIPFVTKWACDIDKHCKETYFANHTCEKWYDDITKINVDELEEVDLYVFGFPCFVGSELVLTNKGLVQIKYIKVGDYVITHNNRYKKVINFFEQGKKEIFEVKSKGLLPIKTTENHPFYIRRKVNDKLSNPFFEKAKNLNSETDYLGFAINQNNNLPIYNGSYCISTHTTKRLLKTLDLSRPIFWWFLGRYLADGWIVEYKRQNRKNSYCRKVILCCGYHEVEFLEKKLKELNLKFTKCKEASVCKFHFSNQELFYYVQQFGRYAENKKLTQDIFNLPVDLLKVFLEGYASGDGTFEEKSQTTKVVSVSKQLILGIQQCVHKVYKIPTSIYETNRPKTTVIEGRTVNQRNDFSLVYRMEVKREFDSFYEDGYIWQPLKYVKNLEKKEEVFNFEVEEDNSYTINNCIVHNCQSYSVAGKQLGLEDHRGKLIYHSLEILTKKQPKYFLAENVKGLFTHDNGNTWKIIKESFENCGYVVKFQILNSQDFGIPQNRQRIFIVGIRKDIVQEFEFPKSDKIAHFKDFLDEHVDEKYFLNKEKTDTILNNCFTKQKNFKLKSEYGEVHAANKNGLFGDKKIRYTGIMWCQNCIDIHGIIYPDDKTIRKLTPRECARLQGFPDNFILHKKDSFCYKQFGNSMTVPVLEAILNNLCLT